MPRRRRKNRNYTIPTCGVCGLQHYNFAGCTGAVEQAAQEQAEAEAAAAEKKRTQVIPEYRTDRDREPGDRLTTLVRLAPNVFARKE